MDPACRTPGSEDRRNGPPTTEFRYDAFISYRRIEPDRRWAVWLHGALEHFRTPKELVRQGTTLARLQRVFRDEEELSASSDLSREIDDALAQSRYLIVVCSPRTPESRWVNEEVRRFRQWNRHDRILALLIEGEPAASFPTALREIRPLAVDSEDGGREHLDVIEPSAADVRATSYCRRRALKRKAKLRLLAPILGCRFDDLRQREHERRRRNRILSFIGTFTLCSTVTALVIISLIQARRATHAAEEGSRSDFGTAQARLAEGRWRDAIAYLGRSLGYNPGNANAKDALWLAALYGARDDGRMPDFNLVHKYPVYLARFSPDGSRLVTIGNNHAAQIWDAAIANRVGDDLRHADSIYGVSFSADSARIITASEDGTARIWEARTGKLVVALGEVELGSAVYRASFSSDGRWVVTAGSNGEARIWDATTGKQSGKALHHDNSVTDASFSADSSRVVTASSDKTARIWDATTRQQVGQPLAHGDVVFSVSFSHDGKRIVTASRDETARVWDTATSLPIGKNLFRINPFAVHAGRFFRCRVDAVAF